jgi:hypothetical protein
MLPRVEDDIPRNGDRPLSEADDRQMVDTDEARQERC